MSRSFPAVALLVLALSACTSERSPGTDDAATAPPPDQSAGNVPPETAGATIPASGPARLDGYGALDFGMTAAEATEAWDGEFGDVPPGGDDATCFHLSPADQPTPAHLAFMFEHDLFVRYSAESDILTAPGGGKRGMAEAELQALYNNALQAMPHKYVEGGKYLSVEASGVAPSKLVFETDAEGKVTEWRVGVAPQVDYVEGCS